MNNALKDYSWLLSVALLAVLGVGCSSVEEKPAPPPPAAAAPNLRPLRPRLPRRRNQSLQRRRKPRRLKSKA